MILWEQLKVRFQDMKLKTFVVNNILKLCNDKLQIYADSYVLPIYYAVKFGKSCIRLEFQMFLLFFVGKKGNAKRQLNECHLGEKTATGMSKR